MIVLRPTVSLSPLMTGTNTNVMMLVASVTHCHRPETGGDGATGLGNERADAENRTATARPANHRGVAARARVLGSPRPPRTLNTARRKPRSLDGR